LEDGTLIRVKNVLLDVKKMIGQFNADGDPIYVPQLTGESGERSGSPGEP
jgi:hypothetical protein